MSHYFGALDTTENQYAQDLDQFVNTRSNPSFSSIKTHEIKTDYTTPTDLLITTGAAKTIKMGTLTYQDLNLNLNPRNVGTGRPTLAAFNVGGTGSLSQFQFAVGDFADLSPIELIHSWAEGTKLEIHIHWCLPAADVTDRNVNWRVNYTYADIAGVFTPTAETTTIGLIPANTPAFTQRYTSIVEFTPATKIGTQVCLKITRIATGSEPSTDPFVLSVGIHYLVDSLGSRSRGSK